VDVSEEDIHALLTNLTGLKLALDLLRTRADLSERQVRVLQYALQAEQELERTLVGRVAEDLGWGVDGQRITVERRRTPRHSPAE
jgi:hypothetical protein